MKRRTHTPVLLVAFALLAATPASAQLPKIPGTGGGGDEALKLQLATSDPREIIQRHKQLLLERQQAIIAAAPDLEAWQTERKRHVERLGQARARLESLRAELAAEEESARQWREAEAAWKQQAEERERQRAAAETAAAAAAAAAAALADGGRAPGGDAAAAAPGEPDVPPAAPAGAADTTAPDPAAKSAGEAAAEADPGPMPGQTFPGYVPELERLIGLLEATTDELHDLVAGLNEERELVAGGIEKADAVLARYESRLKANEGAEAAKKGPVSLERARSLSYDLYLARLELSLVRSREGALVQDEDEQGESTALAELLQEPPPLGVPEETTERTQQTWEEARRAREEANDLAARLAQILQTRRDRTEELLQTRMRVAQIDVRAKEQRVDRLAASLGDSVDRIRITPDELEEEKQRFDSLAGKIAADIERAQSALEKLRAEPTPNGPVDEPGFSAAYVRELQLAGLQEELTFHELRRERMHFVHETYTELHRMLRGRPPTARYLKRFDKVLKERELQRRLDEIGRRHEAWRRQHIQLSQKTAEPGSEKLRKAALRELLRLVELCAKQEYTLESNARLATIVRHHVERFEHMARSTWWYTWRILVSLLMAIAAGALSLLLGRGTVGLVRRLTARRGDPAGDQDAGRARTMRAALQGAGRALAFFVYLAGLVALWFGTAFVALQLLWGVELGLDKLDDILAAPLFLLGETPITLGSIAKLIGTIVLTVLAARLAQAFLRRQVFSFFEWDEGVRHAVAAVLRYIVLFVGLALGFTFLGVGLGAFAVLLGVIGIGIGFGLQNIANNFISGFIILFERPVKKGDFVVAGELEGEVMTINARATTVRTRDNVSVIIPNSEFVSGRVINWSHEDPRVRIHVPVGVAYGSDIAKVERLLLEVAAEHPDIIPRPKSAVEVKRFGDSAIDVELTAWTRNIRARFRIVSDLFKAVDAVFRREGISIPFPQREVRVLPAETAALAAATTETTTATAPTAEPDRTAPVAAPPLPAVAPPLPAAPPATSVAGAAWPTETAKATARTTTDAP